MITGHGSLPSPVAERLSADIAVMALFAFLSAGLWSSVAAADPLPSWGDSAARQAIERFVAQAVDETSAGYIPEAERIATFDNDGTLWAEQPMYFQALFAFDRVKELAPAHPEWKEQEPFASVLKGDVSSALAGGQEALMEIIMATHAGMSATDFEADTVQWLQSSVHPTTGRRYTRMVYKPMLELLDYLRANGFSTWIVSGGGIEFMRPWVEDIYGIPPQQVVGSSIKTSYKLRDGVPTLVRQPALNFIDDKAGKPVGIHQHIGRRPVLAVGNSDGDFEMLEWTTAGDGLRMGVLIHHTDAEREWAYDRDSHIGRLDRGLDEAAERGWVLVDMKKDWKRIFPRK